MDQKKALGIIGAVIALCGLFYLLMTLTKVRNSDIE